MTYKQTLLRRNENMPNNSPCVLECPFVHFALTSARKFLQSGSIQISSPTTMPIGWCSGDAEGVLSPCSGLITVVNVDRSRVVHFSHFSVEEN